MTKSQSIKISCFLPEKTYRYFKFQAMTFFLEGFDHVGPVIGNKPGQNHAFYEIVDRRTDGQTDRQTDRRTDTDGIP